METLEVQRLHPHLGIELHMPAIIDPNEIAQVPFGATQTNVARTWRQTTWLINRANWGNNTATFRQPGMQEAADRARFTQGVCWVKSAEPIPDIAAALWTVGQEITDIDFWNFDDLQLAAHFIDAAEAGNWIVMAEAGNAIADQLPVNQSTRPGATGGKNVGFANSGIKLPRLQHPLRPSL